MQMPWVRELLRPLHADAYGGLKKASNPLNLYLLTINGNKFDETVFEGKASFADNYI